MRALNAAEEDLFDRVLRKPELQPFFFRKLKGLHWFEPLSQRGFLAPEKNPKPEIDKGEGTVNIPYWPVTEYLVTTSIELMDPSNEEYAKKTLNFMKEATSYARTEKYSNYRTWWQFSKIITNIPLHLINIEDIELIDYWLDDPYDRGLVFEQLGKIWLPRLLENTDQKSRQIGLGLIDRLYQINFVLQKAGTYEDIKPTFRADSWYVKQITERVAELAGSKLGLPPVEYFQGKLIETLNRLDNDRFSCIWRPAIEKHAQNLSGEDAINLLIDAYRDSLLGFVDKDSEQATHYINSIFANQYQTLIRAVIYVVNERFNVLKDLVDSILVAGYLKSLFQHELWHLVHNHYNDFSSAQRNKYIELVKGLEILGDNGVIEEAPTAYKRSVWLSAIKDYDNNTAELYREYIGTINIEPEHPDFSSYISVGWGKPQSPISVEHLLTLDTDSLIVAMNTYKPTSRADEFSREGLLNNFKEVIKTRAHEFYREFPKFVNGDLSLICSILESYRELWDKNRELPWDDIWSSLLDFCAEIIARQDYWAEDETTEDSHIISNKRRIISEIGQLIEDGTKSDDHAFDKEFLSRAKGILLVILDHQKGEEIKRDDDAVTVAINSPRGHCIEALVNLTLRACRLADKESGDHSQVWSQVKAIYDTELERSEQYKYEFITLVSMYIMNFLYISPEWTRDNLSRIFDQSDYQKWLCAMQGYSYVNMIHQDVYTHLKTKGDLLKSLDDENIQGHVREKVIQNIVVAYLHDYEDIDNPQSMIATLVKRKKYTELQQVIWFLWTLREEDIVGLKEKAFKLWPKFLEIADIKSKEGRKLLSQLCHWAVFIDKIDATTEKWLMQIAPYAEEDYNSPYLLESLALISESQPLEVQNIWLKMINPTIRDYPPDAIRKILQDIITSGPEGERKAKEVVDAYLKQGIDRPSTFLRELKATIKGV